MRGYIILLLLLIIPFSLAEPSLTFQHEDTLPGETIFGTIETAGEFTQPVYDSDLKFYEGRKEVFFEHGIKFYGGKQYLYIYTTREGDFSLKIENVLYKESEQLKSSTIEKNFSVKKVENLSALSIKPGIIFASTDPKLKLSNKGESTINVTIGEESISIEPVMSYEVTLNPEEAFSMLTVSSYKDFQIPVIFLGVNGSLNQTTEKEDLRSEPPSLSLNLSAGNNSERVVSLYNFGEDNLTKLKSTTSINFMKISKLSNIPPRGVLNITLTLSPEIVGYFSDNFTIEYEQNGSSKELVIPLSFYVLPSGISPENFTTSPETCIGLNGSVCPSEQICQGETTFSKDGAYCCLSTCVDVEKNKTDTGTGYLIGILILLVLGYVGYVLYTKQKKVKPITPEQALTKSADNYSKRISGGVQRS